MNYLINNRHQRNSSRISYAYSIFTYSTTHNCFAILPTSTYGNYKCTVFIYTPQIIRKLHLLMEM